MGTYSYAEFYDLFGGEPEPGEAYLPLDAADHLRKAAREDGLSTSPGPARVHPSRTTGPGVELPACGACGAPAGVPCAKGCEGSRG